MSKLITIALFSFMLVSCSSTYPVRGEFLANNEHFIGKATSGLSGGKLFVTTENQVRCEGKYESKMTFSMSTAVVADGQFTCDDGRVGKFTFSGNAVNGEGFGTLEDGEKFRFTYGKVNINYER